MSKLFDKDTLEEIKNAKRLEEIKNKNPQAATYEQFKKELDKNIQTGIKDFYPDGCKIVVSSGLLNSVNAEGSFRKNY